jgi:ubiquinone biosynthesis protein
MATFNPFRTVQSVRRFQTIGAVLIKHGFGFIFENYGPEAKALRRLLRTPLRKPFDTNQIDVSRQEFTEEELAIHFRLALQELGPTFIKLGQLLSTRPDLLPPIYINELGHLLNNVPPEPWENVEESLQRFYQDEYKTLFKEINPVPIGAASLAQVHKAILYTGEEVVIKVLRSNTHQVIDQDLEILYSLARIFDNTSIGQIYGFVEFADEFAYTLKNELDFFREALNAERFRENFKELDFIHIPKVYPDISGKEILVMEYLEGLRIDDLNSLDAAGYDRKELATHCANVIVKEILEDGFFHADPHPGNLVILDGGRLGVMDFGMVGFLKENERFNLVHLYVAAIEQDVDALIDELINMGAIDIKVDQRNLTRDINRVLNRYYGLPLEAINAGDILEDITPILYEHHIKVPSNLWFLIKALTIMEGVGLTLDPTFDIFKFSKPYVQKLTWKMLFTNKNVVQQFIRKRSDWGNLLDELPRTSNHILTQIERGEFFRFTINDINRILKSTDRMVTRISLSLIVASLVLGIAFLIPQFTSGSFGQIILIVAFVFVAVIGLWFLFTMVRTKK